MEKTKTFFQSRGIGFYFSAAVTLLSVITAIVYPVTAMRMYMNWPAFFMALFCAIANVGLFFLKQYKWMPVASAILTGLGLCFFIYGAYFYVSVVAVGIDAQAFEPQFIFSMILFVLMFGLSVTTVFLKQVKEEN